MTPIDIKDLVTEQMSGVIVLPVQEGQVTEAETVPAFEDDEPSLEQDISLAPVIMTNDEENKIKTASLESESSHRVQVKLDLQDASLYQEGQDPEGGIGVAFDEDSSLERDVALAPVILSNDEGGAFEDQKDILASDSCQEVQIKLDLHDETTSLFYDYKENLKSDPTLKEV